MHLRGACFAGTAAVMFGLGIVLARILGTQIDAPIVAFASLTGGGLLLAGYLRLSGTALLRPLAHLARHDWLDLILLASLGTALPLLVIVSGFARTGAIEGSFVFQLNGVASLVFAVLLLGERVRARQSSGILLLLVGSALVILAAPPAAAHANSGLGDLLILLGAIGVGFGLIPAKRLSVRIDPLLLTAWRLLLGAALLFPILLIQFLVVGHSFLWHPALSTLVLVLPAYAVTNFCIAYLSQQTGLRLLKAWEMAAILQTVPLFATLLAVLLLHDRLTLPQAGGGLVAVLGGLVIALNGDPSTPQRTRLPEQVRAP
ncbi:MAG TPA: DMT family transporter [Ktedonobacterales bacterium]|nr:DMT family transporter [Ktedonobacterales bacterium]